eukprot:3338075-Rhodomonas_salina.2
MSKAEEGQGDGRAGVQWAGGSVGWEERRGWWVRVSVRVRVRDRLGFRVRVYAHGEQGSAPQRPWWEGQ